jgi:putative oxidoreductase
MRRNIPLLLIRFAVGVVFLTEGILKILRPGELGPGRFAHIGLPLPHLLAPFVGIVEIVSGAAMLLNLYAGEAAVLLLCVSITAIVTTKIPILIGHHLGPFNASSTAGVGIFSFLHEARLDIAMFLSLIAILVDSGVTLTRPRHWYGS